MFLKISARRESSRRATTTDLHEIMLHVFSVSIPEMLANVSLLGGPSGPSVRRSFGPSVYRSVGLSVCRSVGPSVRRSVGLSVRLSADPSAHLFVWHTSAKIVLIT